MLEEAEAQRGEATEDPFDPHWHRVVFLRCVLWLKGEVRNVQGLASKWWLAVSCLPVPAVLLLAAAVQAGPPLRVCVHTCARMHCTTQLVTIATLVNPTLYTAPCCLLVACSEQYPLAEGRLIEMLERIAPTNVLAQTFRDLKQHIETSKVQCGII